MEYLERWSLLFDTLITDRHTGIAKYMREQMGDKHHYFDLWHLKKIGSQRLHVTQGKMHKKRKE